jgi:hypothetical protein
MQTPNKCQQQLLNEVAGLRLLNIRSDFGGFPSFRFQPRFYGPADGFGAVHSSCLASAFPNDGFSSAVNKQKDRPKAASLQLKL